MKKGFTLIELLAVIVILAIIALIATPIILGIINDARKESNERSAELYASSVKNAIAAYQLTHPNAPTKFSDLDVQYDGEVECAKEELYADGSFYIAECTVNGDSVDYTYGEQQVTQLYKPQYYSWSGGIIGEELPSDAKTTVLELNLSYPIYLGLDVDSNNKVTSAYVCFTRNGIEHCLKGAEYEAYETNNSVLEYAFKDVENACSLNNYDSSVDIYYSNCYDDSLYANTDSDVSVSASNDDAKCLVWADGSFGCNEL